MSGQKSGSDLLGSLAGVLRRPLGRWSGGREFGWVAAYLALVALPLIVLLAGELPPPVGFWWDFSMGLGFGALAVIGTQFVLTARFRRFTSPFGIDVIYVFHRYLAWIGVGLAATHFGLLWLFHPDALGTLNPLEARWELTSGRVALVMFGLAVVTSQWRKSLRLEYGLWRYSHVGFAVLGFTAAVAHILGVGNYTAAPALAGLWLGVTFLFPALLVWVRVVKPWQQTRAPFVLREVRPERGEAVTVVLEPDGHAGLRHFKPGQFVWLTVGDSPYLLREHPFSIASAPEALPELSVGIKALGDFTARVQDARAGQRAYVDGPYGVFSIDSFPDASGYVFIVGGIGVTPVLSMVRSLAARGDTRPHWLIYGNSRWDEIMYRDELDEVQQTLDLHLVHVIEDPPSGWTGESGFISKDVLERHLPRDKGTLVFFLCGPTPMLKAASAALTELGVGADQIRSELFEFA